MGLTSSSTGFAAAETSLEIKRRSPDDRVVAIAGNPNVGKSTIFNALTGMRQHTGNWPGQDRRRRAGVLRNRALRLCPGGYPGDLLAAGSFCRGGSRAGLPVLWRCGGGGGGLRCDLPSAQPESRASGHGALPENPGLREPLRRGEAPRDNPRPKAA